MNLLTDVMNAIEKLDLKVSNVSKSYATISQLAFEDKDLQKDTGALRKTDNIHQLVDATDIIEMFGNCCITLHTMFSISL